MYSPDPTGSDRPVIAVIGGGASGTLTAIHVLRLVAAGRQPVRIALIDRDGRHGLGQAYATTHPGHLLNSPAGTMSAVAGDPGQLVRWASANGIAHDGFLRRSDYGRYLCETLAEAQRRAGPASTVTPVTSQVVRISDCAPRHPLRLHLAADGHIDADLAVLAIGGPPPVPPCPVPDSHRYIADPWAPGALRRIGDGRPVIVAGTGLTAMDVAIAAAAGHPRTAVHAVSRHALLPRVHRGYPEPGRPTWLPVLAGPGGPVRLGELMWQVRTVMTDRPETWEEVMDALRPHVPRLWQRLSLADRRVFLRHVARYRTAAQCAGVQDGGEAPPPRACPGGCGGNRWYGSGVRYRRAGGSGAARPESLWSGCKTRVHPLAVCGEAGSRRSVACAAQADLRSSRRRARQWEVHRHRQAPDTARRVSGLHGAGRLTVHVGRTSVVTAVPGGIRVRNEHAAGGAVLGAAGKPSDTLFTLGPPLRGLWYETTAIPEIRTQAAALALRLSAAAAVPARPGTAA